MAGYFRPGMLVTDVVMGGISGIQAAIQIGAMLPNCKVLLFSGQAASVDLLEEARSKGHEFEILSKPVHPSDLLAKLRKPVAARNLGAGDECRFALCEHRLKLGSGLSVPGDL